MKKTLHHASAVVIGLVLLGSVVASASAGMSGGPEMTASGLTPMHVKAGQLLTIAGTNLAGITTVAFIAPHAAGVPSPSVSVDPGGMWVRAIVPTSLPVGAVQLSLAGPTGATTIGPLTIDAGSVPPEPNPQPTAKPSKGQTPAKFVVPPKIAMVSPISARVGTRVNITGTNFAHLTWLKFGGIRARIVSALPKAIIAVVPKNARSGKVTLHTSSGGTAVSTTSFIVVR